MVYSSFEERLVMDPNKLRVAIFMFVLASAVAVAIYLVNSCAGIGG